MVHYIPALSGFSDGYKAGITTTTTTQPSIYAPYGGQSDVKPPLPPELPALSRPRTPTPPSKTTLTTTTITITPSYINPDGGCRVYTREEKYKMLTDLGSYNLFMADTAEEAALNFAPVFKKLLYGKEPYPDYEDVRIINGTIERVCRSNVCRLQKLKAPITEEEWLSGSQQVLVWTMSL
ncbi:unnamed protein product [Cylicocyclus nassatus]|uniref:Uncharacterized protein n=1 Tax=Cylicocyclus nassatus TaxID=53992 RepID=A0AA36GGK5_CYLNA|nr:unnamed protein product [Cylicocyclus nassatus]